MKSDKKQSDSRSWDKVVRSFKTIAERYPSSKQAYKATFTVATLYQKRLDRLAQAKDLDRAKKYYLLLIKNFSPKRLTDDAWFQLGEIYSREGNERRALQAYSKVVKSFPSSDQYVLAKKRLIAMRTVKTKRKETLVSVSSKNQRAELEVYTLNDPARAEISIHADPPISNVVAQVESEGVFEWVLKKTACDDKKSIPLEKGGLLRKVEVKKHSKSSCKISVWPVSKNVHVDDKLTEERFKLVFKGKDKPSVAVAKKPVVAVKKKAAARVSVSPRKKTDDAIWVVLDPGHGGKDKGASRRGLLEKDINLDISRRVKSILQKRYRYKVKLTRDDDSFLELEERGEIANKLEANLFVSIHANAANRSTAHGIETYYLGSAKTQEAIETAERENGYLVESVEDDDVKQILASLISTTKINDSSRLAAQVQGKMKSVIMKKYRGVKNLGVKEGPFFVLHDTNMPSILVEVGFVTHRRESNRLKQKKYLYWLAESIAQGIHVYLKEKAPSI